MSEKIEHFAKITHDIYYNVNTILRHSTYSKTEQAINLLDILNKLTDLKELYKKEFVSIEGGRD